MLPPSTSDKSSNADRLPEIDLREFVHLERRSRSEVERQITVAKYRIRTRLDFTRIQDALGNCRLRPIDEIGMIDVSASGVHSHVAAQFEKSEFDGTASLPWVRSLFGVLGEKKFRWYDFEGQNIYEGAISRTLNDTFLVEFLTDAKGEVVLMTYGGARYSERIIEKLRICFGNSFPVQRDNFDSQFMKATMARDEFRLTLKGIDYSPSGEDEYGTVDEASMRTQYSNTIDSDARRIKIILENPRIVIKRFDAKSSLHVDEIGSMLSFGFDMSHKGLVTIRLPEIEFPRPMLDIEFEKEYYNIVRRVYAFITGSDLMTSKEDLWDLNTEQQSAMDFIRGA